MKRSNSYLLMVSFFAVFFAVPSDIVSQDDNFGMGDESQQQSAPASSGYLEEGAPIYGIEAEQQPVDSPLAEIRMLKKQYFREVKRREELEQMNATLSQQIEEYKILLAKRDETIDELKRRLVEAEFKYVALEQKLTNIKLAILRKKLIRESQYPPFYEVKKNDSLWKIAGRNKIYDNNYKWQEIYYANQEKIADPDYIYPGMVLRIPRPELEYEDWTADGLDLDKASKYIKGIHAGDVNISTENIDKVMQEFANELIPGYGQQFDNEGNVIQEPVEELPGNDIRDQTNE
ncbi:MAG: LysM peptidoglycan-binding domain-containing protein [Candidatus Auribacter fodinae]|uniref:LysM peptidoglycan-binding domain-containing protein n=1 Tax=Candidatus Auribacter fodinae TaxID=2093366 RepID=A0A3A4REI5_9BACT|nr:MAG: LysM peptidoglycan-binding domain-containing protein [Candidatus Auribacter fodinae]